MPEKDAKKIDLEVCYEKENCDNFGKLIICKSCERNFDNYNIEDHFRFKEA